MDRLVKDGGTVVRHRLEGII